MAEVNVLPMPAHKLGQAFDAGKAGQQKRMVPVLDAEGDPVRSPRSGNPRMRRTRHRPSMKWVTATGSILEVPTSGGSGQPDDPTVIAQKTAVMHGAGAIRYSVCPITDSLSRANIPKAVRKEVACPAEKFGRGKEYGAHQACPHVERIIAERSAKHAADERRTQEKFTPASAKDAEQRERHHTEFISAMQSVLNKKPTRERDGG